MLMMYELFFYANAYVALRRLLSTPGFQWRDETTPGRLCSTLSAILCTNLLVLGYEAAALRVGLYYFLVDLVYLAKDRKPEMMLHHLTGAFLCFFSLRANLLTESHPWRPITLALIWMEATNPLLHLAILWKTEFQAWNLPRCQMLVNVLLILAWIKLRIYDVIQAAIVALHGFRNKTYITSVELLAGGFVILMVALQVFWLGKLLLAARKVGGKSGSASE